MGAPPGWGPNWKEIEANEQYAASQREVEETQRKAEEEERGNDIFRSGDLVKNTANNKVGLIIEAGYREWIQVHTEGEIRKWPRNLVEVINESR